MRPAALSLVFLAIAAPASAGQTLQAQTKAWTVSPDTRLKFDFPVGELRVEASDDSRVRLELLVKCRSASDERCERFVDNLRLEVDQTTRELSVKVKGYPKFNTHNINLQGVLQVPRGLAVELDMGVGDLEVEGLAGNLEVDLGVGEADLNLVASSYRSASVEVGVGDATLRAQGKRRSSSGFVGRSVSWNEGGGSSRAKLHVGVGDATVRMD